MKFGVVWSALLPCWERSWPLPGQHKRVQRSSQIPFGSPRAPQTPRDGMRWIWTTTARSHPTSVPMAGKRQRDRREAPAPRAASKHWRWSCSSGRNAPVDTRCQHFFLLSLRALSGLGFWWPCSTCSTSHNKVRCVDADRCRACPQNIDFSWGCLWVRLCVAQPIHSWTRSVDLQLGARQGSLLWVPSPNGNWHGVFSSWIASANTAKTCCSCLSLARFSSRISVWSSPRPPRKEELQGSLCTMSCANVSSRNRLGLSF